MQRSISTSFKDAVAATVNERKSSYNVSKKISKRHYETDSDSESITSNSTSSSNADHDQLDSSSVFDDGGSIDSTNQTTNNKKSVQFWPIVRVRRIPPNSAYFKEKTNMFWTRLELETFKWESTYEILYGHQYDDDYAEDEFEYPPEFTYE